MADPIIVNCVWTTGAVVKRVSALDGVYDEELVVSANAVRLHRLNAGAPVLNAHQTNDVRHVIGAVEPGSARIEAGQGLARLRLSSEAADADIVGKIRDGIIKGVSIGYVRLRVEEVDRPGLLWPLRRVVDWEPHEITVCAIGADAGAILLRDGAPATEAARIRMELAARRLSMTSPFPPGDGRLVRLSDDQAARRRWPTVPFHVEHWPKQI